MKDMNSIKNITIKGFKSISSLEDFELGQLNIIVGANGAGKSNFIQIFNILYALSIEGFQRYMMLNGSMDSYAYQGLNVTPRISIGIELDSPSAYTNEKYYDITFEPSQDEHFLIDEHTGCFAHNEKSLGQISKESHLYSANKTYTNTVNEEKESGHIYEVLSKIRVYHFDNSSNFAPMRRPASILDHSFLRSDASNIAPYLLFLKNNHPEVYQGIVYSIQSIIPFFEDFTFERTNNPKDECIMLTWKQKGSTIPMQSYHLSDGALRFICLATALQQYETPSIIVIDEPELGLHPEAIEVLAELISDASKYSQIIISTQSPYMLDQFDVNDVIIAKRNCGQTTFNRIQRNNICFLLENNTLGDLWARDIIQGGIAHEAMIPQ